MAGAGRGGAGAAGCRVEELAPLAAVGFCFAVGVEELAPLADLAAGGGPAVLPEAGGVGSCNPVCSNTEK